MDNSEKCNISKIKIKQEKPSPPRKKTKDADEIMNEIIPTLFGTSNNSDDINGDEKKSIKPVKSSNEILTELFKVFNAKPPETLLHVRTKKDKKKHKKHKKQKKKKSKKKGRSSSDDDDDDDDDDEDTEDDVALESNHKSMRKHKKKKKSKNHSDLSDDNSGEINIKAEENNHFDGGTPPQLPPMKRRHRNFDKINDSDFTISDLEDHNNEIISKKHKSKDTSTASKDARKDKTMTAEKSPIRDPGKIIIKSLINTQIFKEVEQKQQKARDRNEERHRRHHKDRKLMKKESDESLSLSDEETYLKERENYYKQNNRDVKNNYRSRDDDFYDRKNRYGSNSRNDRDRNERNHRGASRDRFRGNWRDGHDHRRSRSRSRRRSRSQDLKIDKKRLLEIARKNAITMFKKGSLPGTQTMTQEIKDKVLLKMRYGGKTVEDLTDFCKKLSNGENLNDISDLSSNDDSDHDRDGNDKAFHHPFVLKDRGPIVMNIKNAIPIPPKSAEQTKAILMQFPVSSGQHHRLNESEWVPVPATKKPDVTTIVVKPPVAATVPTKPQAPKNVFAKPLPDEQQQPAFVPIPGLGATESSIPALSDPVAQPNDTISQESDIAKSILALPPPAPPPTPPPPPPSTPQAIMPPQELETVMSSDTDSIFPQSNANLDVSSIITKRLNAMRRLQENPMDSEAIKMMYNAQKDMSAWANSKHIPGQFTGSTGVNVLSAKQLNAGYQPWARKDQLITTTPVSGGMGMHLLQKMGWKPGEGLGRDRNGALQPLLLEVKLDKRGLLADEEDPKRRNLLKRKRLNPATSIAKVQEEMEAKHPVSLLGELATKRHWSAPTYEVVNDNGPPHSRNFIFKVIVNGIVYQPSISSNTKKQAKATAAKYCLQQMGVLSV